MRFGYCERDDAGFWAEPVNAVTNGAFLAAALALAGATFAVSLTMRSLDGPLCGVFPLGTHWLWHLLNALVLYLLLRAAVLFGPRPGVTAWSFPGR